MQLSAWCCVEKKQSVNGTHGEKDAAMADLQHRLDYMETDYEKIIHVSWNTQANKPYSIKRQLLTGPCRVDRTFIDAL